MFRFNYVKLGIDLAYNKIFNFVFCEYFNKLNEGKEKIIRP